MKTKSLIAWLVMLALVFGAHHGVTAAGDSQKKKPPAQDTHTITQLDIGANVASSGQLIIGVSGAKGHRTHAFVWTEAGGLVEMPSLGRLENVGAASRTGAFTGFTVDKKSNGPHAVLWVPPASSKQ